MPNSSEVFKRRLAYSDTVIISANNSLQSFITKTVEYKAGLNIKYINLYALLCGP